MTEIEKRVYLQFILVYFGLGLVERVVFDQAVGRGRARLRRRRGHRRGQPVESVRIRHWQRLVLQIT